ncbi:hypothetical protein [Amycolatopsis lurida]|nr:hypothetical protein [Amycolatopsis lurida]
MSLYAQMGRSAPSSTTSPLDAADGGLGSLTIHSSMAFVFDWFVEA